MEAKMEKNWGRIKKTLFITLGSICVALGAVGIFVPLLPTTPFLLLAAYFYVRSSKKLHSWLMNHRVFGKFLKNYIEHRAITKRMRIYVLTTLWITLVISSIAMNSPGGNFILLLVGVGVTIHLSFFDTINSDTAKND